MDEDEVKAVLKELDHQFISRDNIICYIVIQKMQQFVSEFNNARQG